MKTTVGRVIEVFDRLGARWALIGAHAVGVFTEPRATVDFDFIVEEPKLRAVIATLERELGDLRAEDLGPALRLAALDIDLIRSSTHPLFKEALDHVRDVDHWKIPVPEVLIVLKFLSAVSPWRGSAKRTYDVGDLRALVQAVGPQSLDRDLMHRLAARVYPGAESEFEDLFGRLERGEPISI